MNSKQIIAILSAALIMITLSCTRDVTGHQIRFQVVSALPGNTASTKTAYSGYDASGNPIDNNSANERIDWVDGDCIRIYSPQAVLQNGTSHYADYSVNGDPSVVIVGGSYLSRASISPYSDANALQWGSGKHEFYAVYPIPTSPSSFVNGNLAFTIPEEQNYVLDMSYAPMLAKTTNVTPGASEVNFTFYPQFTAYAFSINKGQSTSISINSFTLSSEDAGTYLSGAFTVSADNYNLPQVSDGNSQISVAFSPSMILDTETPSLSFVVLALPFEATSLKLTFETEEFGNLSLRLKYASGTPITFLPKKKYHIYGMTFPSFIPAEFADEDAILWNYTVQVCDQIVWSTLAWTGDNVGWAEVLGINDNMYWDNSNHTLQPSVGDSIEWEDGGSGASLDTIEWE